MVRADATLYSVPTTLGAAVLVTLVELDAHSPVIGSGVVAGVVAWRVAAIWFGWTAPTAFGRRN